jgi:hypothetical protein
MAKVDPFVIQWPRLWLQDPQIEPVIRYLNRFLHDLWVRTGGSVDTITNIEQLEEGALSAESLDRIDTLEQIEDLIPVVDKQFYSAIKTVNYTAVDGDFIEAQKKAVITLDPNATTDDQIVVANGDGTQIKVVGTIKYRQLETSLFIGNQGTSLHFQYFGDYWRVR